MNWFNRIFRGTSQQSVKATVRSVTFDTAGLRVNRKGAQRMEWIDRDGDIIVAAIERNGPNATAPLLDIDALRAHHRKAASDRGGSIVSVDLIRACGLPVVRVIEKYIVDLAGVYEGAFVIPLKGARFTLKLRAKEIGTTGVRDAFVTAFLAERGLVRFPEDATTAKRRMVGWGVDPYDPSHDNNTRCSMPDDERLDELFEKDPLSKVRRWLQRIVETLTIDESVRPTGIDDGFVPSDPATRVRSKFPTDAIAWLYTAHNGKKAEDLALQAIALVDGEPAKQDRDVAEWLILLAFGREMQDKMAGAEWAFARAHRILKTIDGEFALRTLQTGANLGRVQVSQRRFDEAERLLLKILPHLKTAGTDSDVAVTLNDLGLIRQGRNDHTGAVKYFEVAHARFERAEEAQGEACGGRATVLNNLAKSLKALGDRRGASAAIARARNVVKPQGAVGDLRG